MRPIDDPDEPRVAPPIPEEPQAEEEFSKEQKRILRLKEQMKNPLVHGGVNTLMNNNKPVDKDRDEVRKMFGNQEKNFEVVDDDFF